MSAMVFISPSVVLLVTPCRLGRRDPKARRQAGLTEKFDTVFRKLEHCFWETLAKDMPPLQVVNRGFGGAKINDVVYYADRLVAIDELLAIAVFVGTNDIHPGNTKGPGYVFSKYAELVRKVRDSFP